MLEKPDIPDISSPKRLILFARLVSDFPKKPDIDPTFRIKNPTLC
jgi:hypothetical protein